MESKNRIESEWIGRHSLSVGGFGYVLESDKHEHGQCQREQADQVAQAIDVGGQLDGSIESWARLSYVMASLIIRVVVPVAIQMAVPGGVLCGHGQTEDKSASVRD